MNSDDSKMASIHDQVRAGVKDYDTEEDARKKIKDLRESDAKYAASNTGDAGFEWIFEIFMIRRVRHFLAGVTLSIFAAWALFHVWIVAPSPTGFVVPTKTLGANWSENFRNGMRNAGIMGAELQKLMANCTASSCKVAVWPEWKGAAPANGVLPVDFAYCQSWDRVRLQSQSENNRPTPPSARWRVTEVNLKDGGKASGCTLSEPISYIDHFWFDFGKSLVVLALLAAGIVATVVHLRRLPKG